MMASSYDVKKQNVSEETPKSSLWRIHRSFSYKILYESWVKFV